MEESEETNSGAHGGAESQTKNNHPDDLIGRTVEFLWERYKLKKIRLRGKVVQAGRAPNTVIIAAEAHTVKPRRGLTRQAKRYAVENTAGVLHCRPVSEIEVLA